MVPHLSHLQQPMWSPPRAMVINEIKGMERSRWMTRSIYKISGTSDDSNSLIHGLQIKQFYKVLRNAFPCILTQQSSQIDRV